MTGPIDLLDTEQDDAACQWIEVHARAARHLFGERGSAWTLEEIRAFHRSPTARRVSRAAWVGDRLVGALEVRMPTADNLGLALVWLSVDPDHRRRGVGGALLREGEAIAEEHGRASLIASPGASWISSSCRVIRCSRSSSATPGCTRRRGSRGDG